MCTGLINEALIFLERGASLISLCQPGSGTSAGSSSQPKPGARGALWGARASFLSLFPWAWPPPSGGSQQGSPDGALVPCSPRCLLARLVPLQDARRLGRGPGWAVRERRWKRRAVELRICFPLLEMLERSPEHQEPCFVPGPGRTRGGLGWPHRAILEPQTAQWARGAHGGTAEGCSVSGRGAGTSLGCQVAAAPCWQCGHGCFTEHPAPVPVLVGAVGTRVPTGTQPQCSLLSVQGMLCAVTVHQVSSQCSVSPPWGGSLGPCVLLGSPTLLAHV